MGRIMLKEEKSKLEHSIIFLDGVLGIGIIADEKGKEIIEIAVSCEGARQDVLCRIEAEFPHLRVFTNVTITTETEYY